MAYARYDFGCEWYIFWTFSKADAEREQREGRQPKTEERLAIWHSDHRAAGPEFSYAEVVEMLGSADFTRIPGFAEVDRKLIVECLTEFVNDVDADRASG